MGEVGCYSLNLYCDSGKHPQCEPGGYGSVGPAEFTGRTRTECVKYARRSGWLIDRNGSGAEGTGRCICPTCRTVGGRGEGKG